MHASILERKLVHGYHLTCILDLDNYSIYSNIFHITHAL